MLYTGIGRENGKDDDAISNIAIQYGYGDIFLLK